MLEIDRYQTLIDARRNWQADRPVMAQANQSLLDLWVRLHDEVTEAGDEVQEYEIALGNGCVAPQLVDKLAKELDDVFWFLVELYSLIGVDLYTSAMDKMAQNHLKHPSKNYSNGRTYPEAFSYSRQLWSADGGSDKYYSVNPQAQKWN